MSNLLILLIVLAIPMINSLAYFFTEKKGSLTKRFYLKYINLFFIFSAILSFIIMNIGSNKGEAHYYAVMMYFFFFIPLCWILFFINVIVQQINSEKRKKQSQSNVTSNEEDSL